MQHSDLLSLFQRPPQQPTDSGQPAAEKISQPIATPEPPQPASTEGQGSKDIESLFRGLQSPTTATAQQSPPIIPPPIASPESVASASIANTSANNDKQQAILNLLGTVNGPRPQPPREAPLAPSIGTNTQPTNTSQPGKQLLEQLVSGNPPPGPQAPQYPLAQQVQPTQSTNSTPSTSTTGMPASHSVPPPNTHGQHLASAMSGNLSDREAAADLQRKALFDFISPYEALQSNQSQSQLYQPPNQPLNSPPTTVQGGPSIAKKKPVPAYNPSPQQVAGSTNASPQVSPKQSQLQRRHTPSPDPGQYAGYQPGNPPTGDNYTESLNVDNVVPPPPMPNMPEPPQEPRSLPTPPGQAPGPQHGPLPPIPSQQQPQQQSSPVQRLAQQVQQPLPSPPMRPSHPGPNNSTQRAPTPPGQRQVQELAQQQLQGQRSRGSPASTRQANSSNQPSSRDGASSPAGSGSGSSGKRGPKPVQQPAAQTYGSPGGQSGRGPQTPRYSPNQHALITVDVTSPLASTLAAPDIVSITPIALLKLEPTYTRGTTIGVANFIAYSMSRGRIRLIGRQTGERALLKLPATFPAHAQVQDMVISGTKLACVSTDGGLVVWDIPEDIEDDAASVSRIILHVPPPLDAPGFKVVKWHPKQSNLLAVASEQDIFLLNIEEAYQAFGSEGVSQDELGKVATVFSIPSPLVSITFDVPQIALASISVDSTITLWSIKDKLPFWSGRVHGEGLPSSIDFLEGGLVVGRNQGNIIQLLPVMSTTVLSTIKFSLGGASNTGGNASKAAVENPELMFGHLCYDPASRILWVASSARNSLFAVKIGTDSTPVPSAQPSANVNGPAMSTTEPTSPTVRPTFDQIVEFPCSMPTINLTLVAADAADEGATWTRDPSLVVSAFCVHAGGVDQINIGQDAYDIAAANTAAKLPSISFGPLPTDRADRRTSGQNLSSAPQPLAQQAPVQQQPVPQQQQQQQQPPPQQAPVRPEFQQVPPGSYTIPPQQQQQVPSSVPSYGPAQRSRTPPLDHGVAVPGFDPTLPQQAPVAQPQIGGKGKAKDVKQSWKASPSGTIDPASSRSDTEALVSNVTKEIRKVEENLNNKISRLIVKELDKQHSRLEDIRLADQTADFERQEKILKLISTELTKNTTRVVESAVKNVIQNSVLPALETVTRSEVKAALNTQIAKGLADSMRQTLPLEIEKLLLRPDVSNNVARTFSAAITPTVERHVKETITMTLIPAYTQATDAMHQEISREIHAEILSLKKEVVTWQSDALKGTENLIRNMEQSIRSLTEQVQALSAQVAASNARAATPARTKAPEAAPIGDYQPRQQVAPPPPQNTSSSFMSPYSQPPSANWVNAPMNVQQPLGPPPSHHPSNLQQAQAPPPPPQPARTEDWDDTFLTTLGLHDQQKLRELLHRCPPDVVMPTSGQPSPLSQTVILALIHRLALSLTEVSPADDMFKTSLWWLQRSAYALNPNDNVIAPYIGRVLQTAVSTLNTTGQRLNVLPGPGLQESSNMIAQIQQSLSGLMT